MFLLVLPGQATAELAPWCPRSLHRRRLAAGGSRQATPAGTAVFALKPPQAASKAASSQVQPLFLTAASLAPSLPQKRFGRRSSLSRPSPPPAGPGRVRAAARGSPRTRAGAGRLMQGGGGLAQGGGSAVRALPAGGCGSGSAGRRSWRRTFWGGRRPSSWVRPGGRPLRCRGPGRGPGGARCGCGWAGPGPRPSARGRRWRQRRAAAGAGCSGRRPAGRVLVPEPGRKEALGRRGGLEAREP